MSDPAVPPGENVYIALGSNLGDREQHLAMARDRIAALADVAVVRASGIEETAPLGEVPQGPYLNQMIVVHTSLSPRTLLAALQRIEQDGGRQRDVRWGARTIDLDIVLCERSIVQETDLTIPHPAIADRDFWRRELAELGAPGYVPAPGSTTSSYPTVA
jgi:2-amino-4-hydroxy-6-hydroxymethyldihydropteridine diphosphokinase